DLPRRLLSRRSRGVAGDHQELGPALQQIAAHLLDVLAELVRRARPVGKAGVVPEVDVVLLGKRDQALVQHGEAAHPRVEHRDRLVRSRLRHQPVSPPRSSNAPHSCSLIRRASARPAEAKAPATSSISLSNMPEHTIVSGRSATTARCPAQSWRRFPVRFATPVRATGGRCPRPPSRSSASSTPFTSAFARAVSREASSRSQPLTGAQPSFAAATASTPEPVPQSAIGPAACPPCSSSTSNARQSLVV